MDRATPTYESLRRDFDWADVFESLGWDAGGPVNVAATLADRHVGNQRLALDWHGRDGARRRLSFDALADASARFAEILAGLGVGKGDRVAVVMPRVPETVVAMLGIWKTGAVYLPIFSAFAADAIRARLVDAGANVLIGHGDHRDTLGRLRGAVAATIVVGGADPAAGEIDYEQAMAATSGGFQPVPVARTDGAALLYTSGSTGPPKGVVISANFVAATTPGGWYCAEFKPGDVFWCSGDPAWGYGLVCYALALAHGVGITMWREQPSAETVLDFMAEAEVTNLATVPTVLRAIMALGEARVRSFGLPIRRIWTCGEPLNAEVVRFFRSVWDATPLDTYGSSEMGLPVGNLAALAGDVPPGSMGRAIPGHHVTVVDAEGRELGDDEVGLIGLAPGGEGYYAVSYWNNAEFSREVFGGPWIVTNDLGRRDSAGYLWFEGRADDVINSAGYRIGPFEVESALLEHAAVAEAGVVGKPDALRGHIVKAYVVLGPEATPGPGLEAELIATARTHLGAHAAPREIAFVATLPKTDSGKIQRFVLRDRAAGENGA